MTIDTKAYADHLVNLYQRQLATSDRPYLQAHTATRAGVLRQVEAAKLYLPHVRGRVLDWGCFHAPDSCLVRLYCGDEVELFGCDIHAPETDCFPVFHQEAGLRYQQVDHPYHIPYEDNFFDTVIGDGVLEHVPNDYESLKELYRILKPNGVLILSCLPNARSYLENIAGLLRLPHHIRTYTMREAKAMLLHSGFEPFLCRHLQMMPSMSGLHLVAKSRWLRRLTSALWSLNGLLEALWPLNRLSSNLFVVARIRQVIAWRKKAVVDVAKAKAA
jgi:SAM-dependent methyltransferase